MTTTLADNSRSKNWRDQLGEVRVEEIVCFTVEAETREHERTSLSRYDRPERFHVYRTIAITHDGRKVPVREWMTEAFVVMNGVAEQCAAEIGVKSLRGERRCAVVVTPEGDDVVVKHVPAKPYVPPHVIAEAVVLGLAMLVFVSLKVWSLL